MCVPYSMTISGLSAGGFASSVRRGAGRASKSIPQLGHASEQPVGVWDSFSGAPSAAVLVESAFECVFPLGSPPPLPPWVSEAVAFTAFSAEGRLKQFPKSRLGLLGELCPRPAFGEVAFNAEACSVLSAKCGLFPDSLIDAFKRGFPVVGDLSVPGFFPPADHPSPVCICELLSAAPKKWDDAVKACVATPVDVAGSMWGQAMKEVAEGWLEVPQLADSFDWSGGLRALYSLCYPPGGAKSGSVTI